jgi:hypothetical protein
MKRSESDITLNPEWQAEQMDRLLGFEILTRALQARYHPVPPELLADKVGANKGFANNIIVKIQRRLRPNEKRPN